MAAKQELSQILEQTSTSICFQATSNDVVAPQKSQLLATTLEQVLQQSRPYRDAMDPPCRDDLYYDEEEGREYYFAKNEGVRPQGKILQSSSSSNNKRTDDDGTGDNDDAEEAIYPAPWGLLNVIMEAYNKHHCLVLRPDDIWQAILTQFSFYVNKHSQELQVRLVSFPNGKKTVVIEMVKQGSSLSSVDFGQLATRMVQEKIAPNLKENAVEWLLPNFSTTTSKDRIAASITVAATVQSYFEIVSCIMCGIPEVTLEGTPEDWRRLRQKMDHFPSAFDLESCEMSKWHAMVTPVLDQFVASAEGRPSLEFWDKVCCHHRGMSGPTYLSGWVTVFCCFTTTGDWQGDIPQSRPRVRRRTPHPADKIKPEWPFLDMEDHLPCGAVSVPVLVDDRNEKQQYHTHMLAGQFAFEMLCNGTTTLRPRTDWRIAYNNEKKNPTPMTRTRKYKDGEIRPTETRTNTNQETAASTSTKRNAASSNYLRVWLLLVRAQLT